MAILGKLSRYSSTGLLLLRLGIGFMMILHGYPKLLGGTAKWNKLGAKMSLMGIDAYPVFWGFMASAAEAIGGLLLILGFLFRPTTFLMLFTMIVAATSHLVKNPTFPDGVLDSSEAIELGFVFLALFILGPGKYSIDKN
jgi:putative oxidoreductase